jgi:hypothetical protein
MGLRDGVGGEGAYVSRGEVGEDGEHGRGWKMCPRDGFW